MQCVVLYWEGIDQSVVDLLLPSHDVFHGRIVKKVFRFAEIAMMVRMDVV